MAAHIKSEEPQIAPASSQSSLSAIEKGNVAITSTVDLDHAGETKGYVLDEETLKDQLQLAPDAILKKSKNGKVVLIPQPTDDFQDPLNWPEWKKHLTLLVIAVSACTADYSAATGASALLPQAQEWHISPNTVNHATAGNTFMLGVGGLVTVWLSAWAGRLPVLFWFQCLSAATAAWAAAAHSFESFMAARILNGFCSVAAAGGGLMWIKDVWFYHEHPKKINVWSTAIILSPFLGPQFMAALISADSWRAGMWLCFGIIGLGLVLTTLFADEPFYPRHLKAHEIPARKSRLLRLVGIEQYKARYTTNTLWEAGRRPVLTLLKLPVLLTSMFYFFDFPWTIANNTTISVFLLPEYHFSYLNLAAIYTAPIIGAICGLVCGHFVFDLIGKIYAKRHQGRIEPEARLIILWFILPLKIVGYNLIGLTIQKHWSYWILAVGWGIHNFGTIMTTSALGAYLIDAYPEASGESAAWLNAARTFGGFIVGYLQINWASSAGTQTEYGIESAIMGAAFFIIAFLQFFGARLRHKQGVLSFKTH